MASNYLYNTTKKTKFEIEQMPFSDALGIQKAFVGKSFGNTVMPVRMYVNEGKLYFSNTEEREGDMGISEDIRDQFERVNLDRMEATEDNPIVWYITSRFEMKEACPLYMRCAVLGDKMLLGIIAGEIKIEDHEGKMVDVGRCIPARESRKKEPIKKEVDSEELKGILSRKNPITGKPFIMTGIVDISIELTRDGIFQTTLSHSHCVNYRPVEVAKEIERLERRDKRRRNRSNAGMEELIELEEKDRIPEIVKIKPIVEEEKDDDEWLDEILAEENEQEEETDEDDWS